MPENQLTIVRLYSDGQYSTITCTPNKTNAVDFVITKKKRITEKPSYTFINSRDIRREHLTVAKLSVTIVLLMLLVMFVLVIFCWVPKYPCLGSENNGFIRNVNSTGTDLQVPKNTSTEKY